MRLVSMTVITIVTLATQAATESRIRFDVMPTVGYNIGTTRYRMVGSSVMSRLDFPVNQVVGGGRVEIARLIGGRPDWAVSLEAERNLNDPSGTFDDRDWYVSGDGSLFEFSNTKSRVEGSMTRLRGEVAKTVWRSPQWDIAVFAGMVYQSISQTATDVDGWQLVPDSLGNVDRVTFYFETRALTYDIKLYQSMVGLVDRYYPNTRLMIEARLAFSPVMYAKDLDDHLLRGFQTTCDGYGFGTAARLAVRFEPFAGNARGRTFAMLIGDFYHSKVNKGAVLEYYRDEEGEPYPKGTVLYGVPHEIVSRQFGISLRVGRSF